MRHVRIIGIFGVAALLGAVLACSPGGISSTSAGSPVAASGGGGSVSSPATALAVTAISNTIAPGGGSTTITAWVVDSLGIAVPDGTVVSFSFAPGDQVKASLSSGRATTAGGLATVVVTATITTDAIAVINAASGAATGSIAITISAASGGGPTGTVTVAAAPSQVPVNSTSSITATVKDGSGNPVNSGVTVNFSVSNGNGGLSALSAGTNASGVATVQLTGLTAGQITITASVPSLSGIQGQVSVTVLPAPTVPTLNVSASSTSMLTNSSMTISALLSGASITVSGQTITFSVGNPAVATLSAASAVTDANGLATVTLTSLTIASPVSLTVTYVGQGQSLQGSMTITVSAPPADTITVVANPAAIPVYGTTSISATVTGGGQNVPDGTSVNFILGDSTYGSLSNISGSTVGGKATTSFVALGRAGTISVAAVAGGVSNSAAVTVQPADAGSIQFVSAVPQVIGIAGSGQPESSTVTFAVKDVNGNPVVDGTSVDFTMQGPGGGEYIGSTQGATTASAPTVGGKASVILHSGTVAGPVTIIATTVVSAGPPPVTISSSASQISIGGGVASETHWNLTTSQWNLSGLAYSGKTADISAWVADRFGNYNILNGTTISFSTEAGAIDRQGVTDDKGTTTVVLRTQAPYPADVKNVVFSPTPDSDYLDFTQAGFYANEPWYSDFVSAVHNPRDGWVTVLATTMGEESFLDENGDGLFTVLSTSTDPCPPNYTCQCDNGQCITSQPTGTTGGGPCTAVSPLNALPATCAAVGGNVRSEGFIDISEPFIDVNDNGRHDNGQIVGYPPEQFIDSQADGKYDPPNGKWDGPDCQTTGCLKSKMIWKDIRLVFSGHPYFYASPGSTNDYKANPYIPAGSGFSDGVSTLMVLNSKSFSVIVGDENLNALEPGTTITASVSAPATISGPNSYTLPDGLSHGPTYFSFTVSMNDPGAGKVWPVGNFDVTVDVVTPSGLVGRVSTPVTILYPALSIATTVLPDGTFTGTPLAYSATLLVGGARGGATWSVTSGSLPGGLSLDPLTGIIAGTPTGPAGTSSFTVRVDDGAGRFDTKALTIKIN